MKRGWCCLLTGWLMGAVSLVSGVEMTVDAVTEQLLRAHAWNFATRYATLSKQGTPEHGYTQAYRLPADCLRVLDVRPGEDARSPQARFSV